MRCTCALKKEYLDPVPEIDLPLIPPRRPTSSRKPRLLKADSDNSLTVFTNGHHKPVHKHNDSAHQCGLPYKIPIPHSVPSKECARRSTDSLPLIRKKEEIHSQLHDSISSAQQEVRLVRSEHGSPEPRASRYRNDNGQLPPLDLSYPGYNENAPGQYPEDYAQSPGGFENYYTSQEDLPVLSAGASGPPVDWSAMDLPLDNGGFSTVYSQPPSYASFEHSNVDRPGLTASSSGEYSEVDDYIPNNNKHSPLGPDRTTRSASTSADELNYNQYSSSFPDLSLASVHSPNNLSELDMHTFLRSTASPTVFEEPRGGMPLSSEAFAKHGLSVHDAQKMAHPDTPTEAMGGLSLPPHVHDVDHVWAPPHFESSEDSLTPECKVEDDEWHQ